MLKFFMALLLAGALPAQTANLTLGGPATARPGTNVTLTLSHDATTAVGWQWTLVSPWNATNALTVAGKTLSCTADGKLCLIWSATTALIPSGPLGSLTFAIPVAQAPGPVVITVGNTFAVNAAGNLIASVGSSKTITILAPADLTGDGRVDLADVQASINLIIAGGSGCDLNGDGQCNILDAFWVVLRCTALNCQ